MMLENIITFFSPISVNSGSNIEYLRFIYTLTYSLAYLELTLSNSIKLDDSNSLSVLN